MLVRKLLSLCNIVLFPNGVWIVVVSNIFDSVFGDGLSFGIRSLFIGWEFIVNLKRNGAFKETKQIMSSTNVDNKSIWYKNEKKKTYV